MQDKKPKQKDAARNGFSDGLFDACDGGVGYSYSNAKHYTGSRMSEYEDAYALGYAFTLQTSRGGRGQMMQDLQWALT